MKAVDKEKREAFVKYRDEIRKARYAVTCQWHKKLSKTAIRAAIAG